MQETFQLGDTEGESTETTCFDEDFMIATKKLDKLKAQEEHIEAAHKAIDELTPPIKPPTRFERSGRGNGITRFRRYKKLEASKNEGH